MRRDAIKRTALCFDAESEQERSQATGDGRFIFAVFVLFLTLYQFSFTPVYAVQLWFLLGLAATNATASTARLRPRRATGAPVWRTPYAVPASSQHPIEQGGRIR